MYEPEFGTTFPYHRISESEIPRLTYVSKSRAINGLGFSEFERRSGGVVSRIFSCDSMKEKKKRGFHISDQSQESGNY